MDNDPISLEQHIDTETSQEERAKFQDLPPKRRLTIALDYDDTYTADPALFFEFVANATRKGHRVFLVTSRYPDAKVNCSCIPPNRHIYTAMQSKRYYCASVLGLNIDIWIDDSPERIVHGV